MNRYLLFVVFSISFLCANSQTLYPPVLGSDAPDWAVEMLKPNPDVFKVKELYRKFRIENPNEKNNYTQFYKKWVRFAEKYTGSDGRIHVPSAEQQNSERSEYIQKISNSERGGGQIWSSLGPFETVWDVSNEKASWQVNVYSIAKSLSNPLVLYCATEGGEIYKSSDNGLNWSCVSRQEAMPSCEAISIHPTDPQTVYAGGGSNIYKTVDSGTSWNIVYTQNSFNCSDIIVHPTNSNIVLACGEKGLIRSTDGGANWSVIYTERVWDLELKPGSPNTVYAAKTNTAQAMCEFFKSTDAGQTFTILNNGWYSSTDAARSDGGARIAVTPANPNVVYVYLIGQSKAGDNGFIGIWKSSDSGNSWTLPHGQMGAPYDCTDANSVATCPFPNLATIGATGTYHQGFYNMDLVVSASDENKLLIGGCSFWRSDDGGATYSGVGGYSGSTPRIHPDIQDLLVAGSEIWLSCDGGINMSTDLFQTHESRKNGVTGSDYWGFGSGWNEDVLVGGRYHNGNSGRIETYPSGTHIRLGGGEAATGYINPGNNKLAYFSDIGNLNMPSALNQPIQWMPSGMYPNESYWATEYSDMVFSPSCYNRIWIGKDNKIYRSDDGGVNYQLIYTFGATAGDWIGAIEFANEDENTMYAVQLKYSSNTSQIWKTTNGGTNWTALTMPAGYSRITTIALDPSNKNILYVAYRQAANGQKVYKSTNGGAAWTNISGTMLNGESVQYLMTQGGTDGGIYAATNKTVYYKNNSHADWQYYGSGLPSEVSVMRLRPFYRDGKIREASYGKGLWEAPLFEPSQFPVCRATVDKFTAYCSSDTFYFDDYSMLNHTNASWEWTFQNGTPVTSSLRNPKVVFGGMGNHLVKLRITDGSGNQAEDSLIINISGYTATQLQEGFEGVFPPNAWDNFNAPNGEPSWKQKNGVGGYGASSNCMICDNFSADGQHSKDDFGTGVDFSNVLSAYVKFDVAYSKYGGQYSDTLDVLVSTDCGLNFTSVYEKGGSDLATAPDYTADVFVPTATQWRTDSVNLDAYAGMSNVVVAFRNIANFGQAIYVDNINLSTKINTTAIPQIVNNTFKVFPNPVPGRIVYFETSEAGPFNIVINGMNGKRVFSIQLSDSKTIKLPESLSSGVYLYEIQSKSGLHYGKLILN